MVEWATFYERLFNFREMRYFDIEGQSTGLRSKAMWSPCGKIKIPVNESADDQSQIEEYLAAYRGEGVQHLALGTEDVCATVELLSRSAVPFLDAPEAYYDVIAERIPGHGEDIERLRQYGILIDGDPAGGKGLLLQVFTQNLVGPIFFEIIQRKGNEGFGEGNFQALFESMERDQIRRGVIAP
jgi:4-hydroxyphenylpyruvate dioxygenase